MGKLFLPLLCVLLFPISTSGTPGPLNLVEPFVTTGLVLQKLETDKALLEKDLAFKACQVKEYEKLLASVRENNHQQQVSLS